MNDYTHYDVKYFDENGVEIGKNYYYCRPKKATQKREDEQNSKRCENLVEDVYFVTHSTEWNLRHPVPKGAAIAIATHANITVMVQLSRLL